MRREGGGDRGKQRQSAELISSLFHSLNRRQTVTSNPTQDAPQPSCQKQLNSPQEDLIKALKRLTEHNNENVSPGLELCIPITINVGGCFIAGEMINVFEYTKMIVLGIKDVFRHALNKAGTEGKHVAELNLFDSAIPPKNTDPSPADFIWLKKVRLYAHQQNNPIVAEPVLAVAIDRISVLVLGHLF